MKENENMNLLLTISNESAILRNLSYILEMFGDLDAEESKHWAENVRSVLLLTQDTVKNAADKLDEIHTELYHRNNSGSQDE